MHPRIPERGRKQDWTRNNSILLLSCSRENVGMQVASIVSGRLFCRIHTGSGDCVYGAAGPLSVWTSRFINLNLRERGGRYPLHATESPSLADDECVTLSLHLVFQSQDM